MDNLTQSAESDAADRLDRQKAVLDALNALEWGDLQYVMTAVIGWVDHTNHALGTIGGPERRARARDLACALGVAMRVPGVQDAIHWALTESVLPMSDTDHTRKRFEYDRDRPTDWPHSRMGERDD